MKSWMPTRLAGILLAGVLSAGVITGTASAAPLLAQQSSATIHTATVTAPLAGSGNFPTATPASADVDVRPASSHRIGTKQATVRVTWQQQSNGYYCGPAAIRMVISARTSSLPSQGEIASYVGTTQAGGTNRYQVRDGVNHWVGRSQHYDYYNVYNVSNPMTNAEVNAMWNLIKADIDGGFAVPVNIVTRPGGMRPPGYAASTNVDHWIVVTGYSTSGGQNYVQVHDPASGRPGFNRSASYNMSLWTLRHIVTKTYVA